MAFRIRDATVDDVPVILHFLQRMAEVDGRSAPLQSTAQTIGTAMSGEAPQLAVLLAEVAGTPVGFASYFQTYSTFLGRAGIWLDDLYVEEAARRGGIGAALLRHLAGIAAAVGCGRIEWSVGVGNHRGIEFYRRHGAVVREHVRLCRLDRDAITRLAAAD
jgi:GNAT superfamily N-acetyltransferase